MSIPGARAEKSNSLIVTTEIRRGSRSTRSQMTKPSDHHITLPCTPSGPTCRYQVLAVRTSGSGFTVEQKRRRNVA